VGGAAAETRECLCLIGVSGEAFDEGRHFQDLTNQSDGIKDFQVAAVASQRYEQLHERANSRTIHLRDLREIDEDIARRALSEFAQLSREQVVALTDHDAASHIEDRNVPRLSYRNPQAHVRFLLPALQRQRTALSQAILSAQYSAVTPRIHHFTSNPAWLPD